MAAYKTGRSRTLEYAGGIIGKFKYRAGDWVNNGQIDIGILNAEVHVLPGEVDPFDFSKVRAVLHAANAGGADSHFLDATADIDGDGNAEIDLTGTYILRADVEEWIEDTISLDPGGFNAGVVDAPYGTAHRVYEALQIGGTTHAEITVAGFTAEANTTITDPLEVSRELLAVVQAFTDIAAVDDPDAAAAIEEVWIGLTPGALFSQSFSDSQPQISDGHAIPSTYLAAERTMDGKIAVRLIPDGTYTHGQALLDTRQRPIKRAEYELRVQAMDADYPLQLTAFVVGFPGETTIDFTGGFTRSIAQHEWHASGTIAFFDQPEDGAAEYSPIGAYLTADSLAAAGELPLQNRILMHGKQWDAVSLSQDRSYTVDDCSALEDSGTTPAGDTRTGAWTGGTHTTASLVSGAIRAVVSGGTGSLLRTFDPAQVFTGYRFLRLPLRTVGSAAGPFSVTIVNNGLSKTWTHDRLGAALTTGADGAFVHADIDLCQPDSSDRLDATDTRWEKRWRNDSGDIEGSADGPYYGVTYADSLEIGGLADGRTYEVGDGGISLLRLGSTADDDGYSKFDCLPTFYPTKARYNEADDLYYIAGFPLQEHSPHTNDSDTTFTYFVRRAFAGNTDGRQSLEETDLSYTKTDGASGVTSYTPILPTIAEFVGRVISTLSGPNRGSGIAPLEPVDTGIPVFPGWSATDLKPSPGGDPPDPALAEDWYYCSDRPAAWLGGAGLRWVPGGTWANSLDIDCTSGATIPAVPLYDSVEFYADCGDVFRHGGAAPVYGAPLTIKATRILRSGAHGVTLSPDHHAAANVEVKVSRVSDFLDEGRGTSNAGGDYKTGSIYAFGYTADPPDLDTGDVAYHPVEHSVYAGGDVDHQTTVPMYPRHRYRSCFVVIAISEANPTNHNYILGWFHRVSIQGGGVRHRRSNTPGGVFVVNTQVTTDATDADPHTVTDWRGTLRTLFCRPASGILETYSNDDGLTWSTPAVAIAGGKHPVCQVGHSGEIFRAAYVSGELKGYIEYPGSTTALATFKDSAGTALAVEDDTFGLSAAHEGAGRWFLSVRIAGEGAVSDWYSADADDGNTWTRIT